MTTIKTGSFPGMARMSKIRTRFFNDILWLILDRPPLNLLSVEMFDQLTAAMRGAIQSRPRLIVLMGAGEQAFSAGIEVDVHQEEPAKELLRAIADNRAAFTELRVQHIATVALVRGLALGGGCAIAALCDTVLAQENAVFGLSEADSGAWSPIDVTYFPFMLCYQATMRLMLTGKTLPAREALRQGLIHQVLTERRFFADAEELIAMLATLPRQ